MTFLRNCLCYSIRCGLSSKQAYRYIANDEWWGTDEDASFVCGTAAALTADDAGLAASSHASSSAVRVLAPADARRQRAISRNGSSHLYPPPPSAETRKILSAVFSHNPFSPHRTSRCCLRYSEGCEDRWRYALSAAHVVIALRAEPAGASGQHSHLVISSRYCALWRQSCVGQAGSPALARLYKYAYEIVWAYSLLTEPILKYFIWPYTDTNKETSKIGKREKQKI